MQALKNPKGTSFPLNLEAFDNPANGQQCVIKSSKKGKVKLNQNLKKEVPSNPIYNIDKLAIHAANHYVLIFVHIINQARKKYLLLLEQNVLSLIEQSMLTLSLYA